MRHSPRRKPLRKRPLLATALVLAAALVATPNLSGYSVQSHEQLIDLTWKSSIVPCLLARYPGLTPAQLDEAHAYAYGGSAIQDLGYYPFGNKFFSNLAHYVRTGDLVRAMLNDAQTPDELAFAIGALSHYVADSIGHSEAVNRAVAIEFPSLERRYGPSVDYAEGRHQHVQTEFAFDVDELANHHFAPRAYLDHVGLKLSVSLLRRAFQDTYGLDLYSVLGERGPALRKSYQFAVRRFIPRVAEAETVLHRHAMPPDSSTPERADLTRQLAQSSDENGWQSYRRNPTFGTYLLAGVIVLVPKVGALSDLSIKGPTPETEHTYVVSLLHSADALRHDLANLGATADLLANRDLDTGLTVAPGTYPLTDSTYAKLLAAVIRQPVVSETLRANILAYYADPNAPIATRKNAKQWAKVQANLATLKAMTPR